jgi:hypothetical protein
MAPRKPQKSASSDVEALKAADEGLSLAKKHAVQYLYSRRQALYALARHYHLDADDLHQEAYEVLLTCLRDFNPLYTKADGSVVTVQFNTFFGNRMESRAMEMRNRDPEYQARQAHMAEMSDTEREEFKRNPPLLVQHLDHESPLQEHLVGEMSSAQAKRQTHLGAKALQESYIEKKLNDLIAAERDDKRRAALQHVKAGGVSSFDEIAYHFGVTDSRASQIFNELMDAFYVQRLIAGDLKSVVYDFRKLGLQDKRAARLLHDAVAAAAQSGDAQRAHAIAATFGPEHPDLSKALQLALANAPQTGATAIESLSGPILPAQLTAEEEKQFPALGVEMRDVATLQSLGIEFRPPEATDPSDLPHIKQLTQASAEDWPPLLITPDGAVLDGERRLLAARAKGLRHVLCQIRQLPQGIQANSTQSLAAAHQLRVVLNSRVRTLSKVELYCAIAALLKLGLAQGKIAELLGTSRPNVIVYAKLLNQGSPRMQALFTDGLLQITNASSAVDLPLDAQDALADFIREHGANWSRGPQFAEAYEAAASGQLHTLAPQSGSTPTIAPRIGQLPSQAAIPAMPNLTGSLQPLGTVQNEGGFSPAVANALKKRQQALEQALTEADIWARQREATIASQTSHIQDLRGQLEALKRENEAQALLQVADEATIANYLKDLKAFYGLQERYAGALHSLESANRQLRSLPLTHRQARELEPLLERIAAAQTQARVQLAKPGGSTPTPANLAPTATPPEA